MKNRTKSILSITLLTLSLFGCNDCDEIFWKKCDPEPMGKKGFFEMNLLDISTEPSKREVNILFQVLDENKIGVDDIVKVDLDVLENNEFIDTETGLRIDPGHIPSKIKTIFLIDISSSISRQVQQIKDASIALIDSKLPNQEFAIFTFDKDLYKLQDFTTDTNLLKQKINSIPSSELENSTNLYGALIKLTNNSLVSWNEEFSTTNILAINLILFTDGRHNADPSITLQNVLQFTINKKIYVAALQSPDLREDPLKEIANQKYFLANNIDQLRNTFQEVQSNIKKTSNSIYFLFYRSTISNPASRQNTLEIRIRNNTNNLNSGRIKTVFNSQGFN
ncbi:MAG: VWA domain-containing protein [Salinivirgaceae bacterium]|jgi:hypothetical protein